MPQRILPAGPRPRAGWLAVTGCRPHEGAVGAPGSFEEGSELAGRHIGAKQVERTAEALGRSGRRGTQPWGAGRIERDCAHALSGSGRNRNSYAPEGVGRAPRQTDGSAPTREVKLCTTWSAESRDEEGLPIRDKGSVPCSAAIESAAALDTDAERSEFAERVLREATRRGLDRAARRAILGDCASWIWNTAKELFPSAIQIADRYHVQERICTIAKAIYGPADPQTKPWAKLGLDELDAENLDAIIQALTEHSQTCEEARAGIDYSQNNRHRMRYVEFRAQGLCTSTGVVEAGCRVAIGERLKLSGMHWTVRGADAIIALRCSRLSGRFEDSWARRSARQKAA